MSERAPLLLDLACVHARADDATEEARLDALCGLLSELVAKLSRPNQIILTIVLALDGAYLGQSATERRRAAGERFRGGIDPVAPGTIRTHHEPLALDLLAELLHAEERRVAEPALFERQ